MTPLLDDLEAWRAAPPAAQDAAIEAVARDLEAEFTLLGAADFACGPRAHRLGRLRHRATGAVFHLVPGGAFTAGRVGPGAATAEGPLRPARAGPLLVARTPVTRAAWDAVGGPLVGHGPRGPGDGDLPVGGVSDEVARAWLARAGLRLPRELEWEWLARAGSATAFFWGDRPDAAWAWVQESAGGRPHEVEAHADRANAFGLVDVAGNVAERCDDDHLAAMEGSAWHEWDPGKAIRGGSWDQPWTRARSCWRAGADPRAAWPDLGLRPVRRLDAGRAS